MVTKDTQDAAYQAAMTLFSQETKTVRSQVEAFLLRKKQEFRFRIGEYEGVGELELVGETTYAANGERSLVTVKPLGLRSTRKNTYARCGESSETHYAWEVKEPLRGKGLGHLVRTLKEARDGVLDFEESPLYSLSYALVKRGYGANIDIAGLSLMQKYPQSDRLVQPVLFKLNEAMYVKRLSELSEKKR